MGHDEKKGTEMGVILGLIGGRGSNAVEKQNSSTNLP